MEEKELPILSVEDLKVYFRVNGIVSRAVDGVSYELRRGETVCLVGESGCGKTVSALTILGLIPMPPGKIAGGRVLFKGENLLDLNEEGLQKIRGSRIAMVFQEPLTSLNPVFTVGNQIGEAIRIHNTVAADELRHRSIELLRDVGIPAPKERLDYYPHQLSGGQRQRVMIAMALSCNPDVIIADEPTTALDVTVQAQILDLLRGLQESRGLSVLYITHDLAVVAGISESVYVMYAGVIVEEGSTTSLFNAPMHPYTRGLLASLPSRSRRGSRLFTVPGTVPDPAHKPAGCPFNPRCGHVVEECRRSFPAMCDYGGGHKARCPVLYKR